MRAISVRIGNVYVFSENRGDKCAWHLQAGGRAYYDLSEEDLVELVAALELLARIKKTEVANGDQA